MSMLAKQNTSRQKVNVENRSEKLEVRKWRDIGGILWFYRERIGWRPRMRAALEREMRKELDAFYAARPPVVAYKPPAGEAFREWLGPIGFVIIFALLCVIFNDTGSHEPSRCIRDHRGGCVDGEDY
jgi:hypothetical protein